MVTPASVACFHNQPHHSEIGVTSHHGYVQYDTLTPIRSTKYVQRLMLLVQNFGQSVPPRSLSLLSPRYSCELRCHPAGRLHWLHVPRLLRWFVFVPPCTSGRREGTVAPTPGLHSHSFRPLLPAIVTGRGSGHSVAVVVSLRSPVVISDPRRKLVLSKYPHGFLTGAACHLCLPMS